MGHRLPTQPASLEHPGRPEPPEEPEPVDEPELLDVLEPADEPELPLPEPLEDPELPAIPTDPELLAIPELPDVPELPATPTDPELLAVPELQDVPELLVELEAPVGPGFFPPQAGKPPTEPPSTPIRASEPAHDALPIVRMARTRAMGVPLLSGRTSARSRRNPSLPP